MKPESVNQMKRLTDARDLLRNAGVQCSVTIDSLKKALEHAQAALTSTADEEATAQILTLREFIAQLSHGVIETRQACQNLAETLEVLASEVTAREEHIPAGVS